mgnify:CR=1 FL=1
MNESWKDILDPEDHSYFKPNIEKAKTNFDYIFDKYVGEPLDYGVIGDWEDIEAASSLGLLEDNEDASKYHELAMYDALKNHPWTNKNRFFGGLLGLASAPMQLQYDMDQDQNPWPQLWNRSKGAFKYMMSPVMESMRLEPEISRAGQDVNRYNVHDQLLNQPSIAMDRVESRVSPSGDVRAYGLRRGGIASL